MCRFVLPIMLVTALAIPATIVGNVLWEKQAISLAAAKEMAWLKTAEGQHYWRCLGSAVVQATGMSGRMNCSGQDWMHLSSAKEASRRVTAREVLHALARS